MVRRSPREWSVGNTWAQTHGLSRTREYAAWAQAKKRCYAPETINYADYGGRGIVMCASWRDDFLAFIRDMGRQPSTDHTLERVNVDGNYEPGNCIWLLSPAQARNRRTTKWVQFACHKMSLAEACELAGVPYATICKRMWRMKLTFFQALAYERPAGPGRKARW